MATFQRLVNWTHSILIIGFLFKTVTLSLGWDPVMPCLYVGMCCQMQLCTTYYLCYSISYNPWLQVVLLLKKHIISCKMSLESIKMWNIWTAMLPLWQGFYDCSSYPPSTLLLGSLTGLLVLLFCSSIYLVLRLDSIQSKVDSALPTPPSNLEQLANWQSLLHTQSSKKVQEYLNTNLEQIWNVKSYVSEILQDLSCWKDLQNIEWFHNLIWNGLGPFLPTENILFH